MIVAEQGDGIGFNDHLIGLIFRQCAAILCTKPEALTKFRRPLLVATDIKTAVERLKTLFNE